MGLISQHSQACSQREELQRFLSMYSRGRGNGRRGDGKQIAGSDPPSTKPSPSALLGEFDLNNKKGDRLR